MQKRQQLAHCATKHKVAQQLTDQRERHAEHAEKDVRDGQVEQKQIGDGAHPSILHQRQDDECVAGDGQQQDCRVQWDLESAIIRWRRRRVVDDGRRD